jgi:hypothetical protein
MRRLVLGIVLASLSACAGEETTPQPGADRDPHGCIASAGYRWCQRTQHCQRPWELAFREGFTNSREAFDGYCGNPPPQ